MASSFRARASSRASQYRQRIASLQAEGRHVDAFHEANRWLQSEAVRRSRRGAPDQGEQVLRDVVDRLCTLAEALPTYQPKKKGGPDGGTA